MKKLLLLFIIFNLTINSISAQDSTSQWRIGITPTAWLDFQSSIQLHGEYFYGNKPMDKSVVFYTGLIVNETLGSNIRNTIRNNAIINANLDKSKPNLKFKLENRFYKKKKDNVYNYFGFSYQLNIAHRWRIATIHPNSPRLDTTLRQENRQVLHAIQFVRGYEIFLNKRLSIEFFSQIGLGMNTFKLTKGLEAYRVHYYYTSLQLLFTESFNENVFSNTSYPFIQLKGGIRFKYQL